MTPQSSPSSSRDHVCLICQDFASGYHYGVPSCVGCKTFFRRTIMKKQKYICQFEGNCPVDKSIRCACRYCRFEKCLSVGMDRNALQQSRDPIGYTKRTRRPKKEMKSTSSDGSSDEGANSTPPSVSPLQLSPPPISPTPCSVTPLPVKSTRRCILQTLADREKSANDLRLSDYLPLRSLHEALCSKALLTDPMFMSQWGHPSERHQIFDLRFVTQQDYHYWHERDWFLLTEYAKTFDVFEALDYQDKAELVRHAAITVPVLVQVWNSPDYGPDTIVFPDGSYFDKTPEPTRPAGLNRKKFQMLDLVLKPFRDLQLDAVEFAAFKAVTFLNPDADITLPARKLINNERVRITKQLYAYMATKDDMDTAIERFARLVLMGTSMSKMACESKEAVWIADFFENIGFSSFARQLFFGDEMEERVVHKL
ncbi:hypothetical protein GCK72_020164 [Caenorhabditis remanei]|uniref:Uncharacterized protein n=1 Tax=Caenorhabditis remanei TaxID=31234 RepID=A0A6A5GED8_CAERE|nr:hypothetical protein GCK72_020164 [Caenorhabditis remanei]KAF1753607.1 hypothetical protein GCK72_020164 [Caenorhabditis remanei]